MATNVVRLPDRGQPHEGGEAERIKLWLHRILHRGDGSGPWSVERLCRKAGTTPTNITRFLKTGYPVPKMATLAKIAAAAGVPPPDVLLVSEAQPYVDIPIILPTIARQKGIAEATMAAISSTRAPARYSECVAVKITANTASLAGVLPGDLVLFDPRVEPRLNDLVVVALDTGEAGVYRVQGDYLVPQAPGSLPLLPLAETHILGVARQVQRDLH